MRRNMLSVLCICAVVLGTMVAPLAAQNLLQDPSFTEGPDGVLTCDPSGFDKPFSAAWQEDGSNVARRNPSTHIPTCPRDPLGDNDSMRGGISIGQFGQNKMWQIVTGLTPGSTYTLSGVWSGGNDTPSATGYNIELRDGSETGTILNDASGNLNPGSAFDWTPFSVSATATSDTIAVVFGLDLSFGYGARTIALDDLSLVEESLCTTPPTISSISPEFGERDTTLTGLTINGGGFVAGSTTVHLARGGETDIVAANVNVISPTELTCDLDLTGAALDFWDVVVTTPDCTEAVLGSSLNVVVAGPNLSNASFELPTPVDPPVCPKTTSISPPDDWIIIQFDNWGGVYDYRDEVAYWPPSCPPPDGDHYVSARSDRNGGSVSMYQTVTVPPGTYTVSGYFAGGGFNNNKIALLDGDVLSDVIDERITNTVKNTGPYDWTFGYATGVVTGDLVTVRWTTSNVGSGEDNRSAQVDALVLQECTGLIELTTFDGALTTEDALLADVAITGSGFSGGTTPTVMLVRTGYTVVGTNVQVADDTNLMADFDLTGAGTGTFSLIVMKDGCAATLADVLIVIGNEFKNGEFELPVAASGCGSGLSADVDDWHRIDDLTRDSAIWPPTCPRDVPAPDPADEHGHYGSMEAIGQDDQRAWQTFQATPGALYQFSGYFAGGASDIDPNIQNGPTESTNTVKIKLVDGTDPTATPLAETEVATTVGPASYDWQFAEVQATAASGVLTAVWEMTGTQVGQIHATHADGLIIGAPCHVPFADADNDGDVDQVDFSIFQMCVTGAGTGGSIIPEDPPYCSCFDKEGPGGLPDGDIDEGDFAAFEACASGPTVPADPACN